MRNIRDISVRGIEIGEAIRLVDDEEVLWAMIQTYCEDGDNKLKAIEEALENRDLESYAVHVHALKSSSRAIGAIRLSERFKELELAGKRGDAIYVRGGNEATIKEYKRILGDLKQYLPENDQVDGGKALSGEDLKPLAQSLKSRDTAECLKCLDSLKDRECSSFISGSLEDIRAAIEIKDYEDAEALLEDVLLTLEVSGL
ncbi:MAG: Hpt domain-containing protein [Lachnospiraceae bacterium]|nr:Hpt domain-containing protein [Lachnospiraceae bacterium]